MAAAAAHFQGAVQRLNPRAAAFAHAAVRLGCEPLNCELRHTHRAGYALHASRAASAAGEPLLVVPRAAWEPFSCDRALEEAERSPARQHLLRCAQAVEQQLGQQGVAGSGNFSRSVLFTVQLLQPSAALTPEGQAYVDFLPTRDELDVPLLWDEERLSLLEGSSTLAHIRQRRGFTRAVHQALFGEDGDGMAVGGEQLPDLAESTIPLAPVLETQYGWASSVLLSRATSGGAARAAAAAAGGTEPPPFTLVPVLDCLNHALEPNCEYTYDSTSGSFTVASMRAIAEDEELTISYGPHGNSRLLRLYGFALSSNPHDSVSLYTPESPVLAARVVKSDQSGAAAGAGGFSLAGGGFSLAGAGGAGSSGAPKHAVQWGARAAELLPQIGELTASRGSLPPRLLGARALLLEGDNAVLVDRLVTAMGAGDGGDDEALLAWMTQFDQVAGSGQMPTEVLRPVVDAVMADCFAALGTFTL